MVAVDEDQKPIQVPELIITTEAEKARNEAAKMRRDMRRQRREKRVLTSAVPILT